MLKFYYKLLSIYGLLFILKEDDYSLLKPLLIILFEALL